MENLSTGDRYRYTRHSSIRLLTSSIFFNYKANSLQYYLWILHKRFKWFEEKLYAKIMKSSNHLINKDVHLY